MERIIPGLGEDGQGGERHGRFSFSHSHGESVQEGTLGFMGDQPLLLHQVVEVGHRLHDGHAPGGWVELVPWRHVPGDAGADLVWGFRAGGHLVEDLLQAMVVVVKDLLNAIP